MKQKIFGKNNAKKLIAGIKARFVSKKDISESTGDATDKVMSQKAVSDELYRLKELTNKHTWTENVDYGGATERLVSDNTKFVKFEKFSGKSLIWNQLFSPSLFELAEGLQCSVTHTDHSVTLTPDAANTFTYMRLTIPCTLEALTPSHTYYVTIQYESEDATVKLSSIGVGSATKRVGLGQSLEARGYQKAYSCVCRGEGITSNVSNTLVVDISKASGSTIPCTITSINVYDITKMLGSIVSAPFASTNMSSTNFTLFDLLKGFGVDPVADNDFCQPKLVNAKIDGWEWRAKNICKKESIPGYFSYESYLQYNANADIGVFGPGVYTILFIDRIYIQLFDPETNAQVPITGNAEIIGDGATATWNDQCIVSAVGYRGVQLSILRPLRITAVSYDPGKSGNVMVREGIHDISEDSGTLTFFKYHDPVVQTMPESIKELPGYGISSSDAENYIYCDTNGEMWYHREAIAVDLGDCQWSSRKTLTDRYAYSTSIPNIKSPDAGSVPDILSVDYDAVAYDYSLPKEGISVSGSTLCLYGPNSNGKLTIEEFKQSLRGVIVHLAIEPTEQKITGDTGNVMSVFNVPEDTSKLVFTMEDPGSFGAMYTLRKYDTVDVALGRRKFFIITEDMCTKVTLTTSNAKAPLSTSYKETRFTIDENAGIEWVEGAFYAFNINTKFVVGSAYRNVQIQIGDNDSFRPLMMSSTTPVAGNTYMAKTNIRLFQYKTTYYAGGALHMLSDSNDNTTYTYLVNTVKAAAAGSPIKIDANGYGARYSLIFPTTPISGEQGLVLDERWSSLVKSSSTAATKVVPDIKFYADRNPMYVYSANVAANAAPAANLYQDYTDLDIRYTANTTVTTWLTAFKRAYLWLKNFNPEDFSFEADATNGNIMSQDKISTRFPMATYNEDIYLYYLGTLDSSAYKLTPDFSHTNRIYKYTPSTGEMVTVDGSGVKKAEMRQRAGIVVMTQEEYDLLESPDDGTLYIIVEDQG